MEHEKKRRFPPKARYPLFLLGLLIIIVGEVASVSSGASADLEAGVGAVGFIIVLLAVVLR